MNDIIKHKKNKLTAGPPFRSAPAPLAIPDCCASSARLFRSAADVTYIKEISQIFILSL